MAGISGVDATTGKALDGLQHLVQSIRDILTTRKGTRVRRRTYGSDIPPLVDRPMNDLLLIEIYVAVVDALDAWEPRFLLKEVSVVAAAAGTMTLDLFGDYLPEGRPVRLEGIQI